MLPLPRSGDLGKKLGWDGVVTAATGVGEVITEREDGRVGVVLAVVPAVGVFVVMFSMLIVAGTKPEKDEADTGRLTVGVVVAVVRRATPVAVASFGDNKWSGASGVVGRIGVIDRDGAAGVDWMDGGAAGNGVAGITDGVEELKLVACDDD